MTDLLKQVEEALEGATPGRRVQFHPQYCPEAKGVETNFDSSHDTSAILPDGGVLRGYARHKHASDAALDALAPAMARALIAAGEALPRVKPLVWMNVEHETAFVALTALKTFKVQWMPDLHVWLYDGRAFEHYDMAKAAAQADYERGILEAIDLSAFRAALEGKSDG